MGFDLSGVSPKTEKGEYFRNNVWWWRPLWNYCLEEKLITQEDFDRGSYNDGYLINEEQATRIGIRLMHLVGQGKTKKYEKDYKEYLKSMPKVKCKYCKGTGKRDDIKCNACENGLAEPWEKSYPFNTENVEEFAQFCINSGGFQIW